MIPATAKAWITCRLVANQLPAKIVAAITAHAERYAPSGCTVKVTGRPISPAVKYSEDDPAFQMARNVLTELLPQPPAVGYVGGGVPVLSYMRLLAGRDLVTFGFQRDDENFHAPNEYMRIPSFRLGQRGYVALLRAQVDQPTREATPTLELNEQGEFVPVTPGVGGDQMGH